MHFSFELRYISALLIGFAASSFGGTPASNCPFHLCTAENLRCSNGRLLHENGCPQCRCEEAYPTNRNSSCLLHGCTTQLLQCVGQLRVSDEGCTLCECDAQGVVIKARKARVPFPRIRATSATTATRVTTAIASNLCPPMQCEETLNCTRLKLVPTTGCPGCECDDANDTELCPSAQEFLSGQAMTRGSNTIANSENSPKFKIILGRLKKGFIPNHTYKILLKAMDKSSPFKEFLIEVGSKPHVVVRSSRKRKKMMKTKPKKSTDSGTNAGRDRECGSGFWNSAKNPKKAEIRLFPDCDTAAMQRDKNIKKITATLSWTAPKCGCIFIRASLLDHTGNTVYLYNNSSSSSTTRNNLATQGRLSDPLYRVVCARAVFRKRPKNKVKQTRAQVQDPIVLSCCNAARTRRDNSCDRAATAYSESFTRFNVLRRTCKSAYKSCCRLFLSRVLDANVAAQSNADSDNSMRPHRRTHRDGLNSGRVANENRALNENERTQKRRKRYRAGRRRKAAGGHLQNRFARNRN